MAQGGGGDGAVPGGANALQLHLYTEDSKNEHFSCAISSKRRRWRKRRRCKLRAATFLGSSNQVYL